MKELYDVIFKRKSMRKFNESLKVTEEELLKIKKDIDKLIPLINDIKYKIEIVEREKTTAKRGEYCMLIYSEKKPNYLLNVGYILEQMDLILASYNIGVCWYGLAKTKDTKVDGLDYVIMMAFGKSKTEDFRKNNSEFKRKNINEIWTGDFDDDVAQAVRLAPSACNTQTWRLVSSKEEITVYRATKILTFIPPSKRPFYNTIDLGICLCFLEIALKKKGYNFERTLVKPEDTKDDLIKIAKYKISR